jgi:hypothetical protein
MAGIMIMSIILHSRERGSFIFFMVYPLQWQLVSRWATAKQLINMLFTAVLPEEFGNEAHPE